MIGWMLLAQATAQLCTPCVIFWDLMLQDGRVARVSVQLEPDASGECPEPHACIWADVDLNGIVNHSDRLAFEECFASEIEGLDPVEP